MPARDILERRARSLLRPAVQGLRRAAHGAQEKAGDRLLGISAYAPPRRQKVTADVEVVHYEALNYRSIKEIARRLKLGSEDVVCDAGAGMGRVVCYFARQPIKQCIGLELDPALAEAARANIARMRNRRAAASVLTIDASSFDFSEVTALIMFNPFGAETMRQVLTRVSGSLRRKPRQFQIAYANPLHGSVVDEFSDFSRTDQFATSRLVGEIGTVFWQAS